MIKLSSSACEAQVGIQDIRFLSLGLLAQPVLLWSLLGGRWRGANTPSFIHALNIPQVPAQGRGQALRRAVWWQRRGEAAACSLGRPTVAQADVRRWLESADCMACEGGAVCRQRTDWRGRGGDDGRGAAGRRGSQAGPVGRGKQFPPCFRRGSLGQVGRG